MLSAVGLAGWLFADLLLVLFLIGFADLPAPAASAAGASPSPSAHPSPSPTPTTSQALSLTSYPITLTVSVNGLLGEFASNTVQGPDADAVLQQMTQKLAAYPVPPGQKPLSGRRAGMVLTWGYGPVAGITSAENVATQVSEILIARQPNFEGIEHRDLWRGGTFGQVVVEVFFFDT